MKIHLVDGTYELFRSHFGAPPKKSPDGMEVGAALGLVRSLMLLLSDPEVTHVAVAFDHVIESFRNKMYAGYKSSAGVDPVILNQFSVAEKLVSALGLWCGPRSNSKRTMRLPQPSQSSRRSNPLNKLSFVPSIKI